MLSPSFEAALRASPQAPQSVYSNDPGLLWLDEPSARGSPLVEGVVEEQVTRSPSPPVWRPAGPSLHPRECPVASFSPMRGLGACAVSCTVRFLKAKKKKNAKTRGAPAPNSNSGGGGASSYESDIDGFRQWSPAAQALPGQNRNPRHKPGRANSSGVTRSSVVELAFSLESLSLSRPQPSAAPAETILKTLMRCRKRSNGRIAKKVVQPPKTAKRLFSM
ncbi:hypothetical protein DIPPA_16396 [Diplonema papillatum]|nr:hypothetical protein DIPPA_16396 [Diplonema papillatum]